MARYTTRPAATLSGSTGNRVDVPVPPMGLGKQLNDMIEWCGERFTDWTHAGLMDKTRRDDRGIPMNVARFYFMDEIAAQQFRER